MSDKTAIELIEGVIEYLDSNKLNQICASSIGHRELQQAIAILQAERLRGEQPIKIPDDWPDAGWYENAAAFCDMIQVTGGFWCMDMDLKYLKIRIDTRTGHFVILDNERAKGISITRILKAMQKWTKECGFNKENPRASTVLGVKVGE